MFNLNLPELAKKIKALKGKPELVLAQVPEGLKPQGKEIVEFLEHELGTTVVLNAEPCFGACDLATKEAEMLKADLLLHFGHSDFGVKTKMRVIYWPVEMEFDEKKVCEKIVEECTKRNWFKIELGTTIQHITQAKKLEKLLLAKHITAKATQVLGCSSTIAKNPKKLDGAFFLGTGVFHALGMQFNTSAKVLALNSESLAVKELDSEKDAYYRRRISQISLSSQAKIFGILISTKPGQLNIKTALSAKKLLEEKKKTAILLAANLLKPEYLTGMHFDAFVNTACPRIAVDDSMLYGKPVLSFKELEIAMGKRKLEEFK
ncbi:MAG: diphthamide biosynthesis enzyme Dph2 [Candidatus Diapherotrites archaeon]|nr:diphthamide biosynthesis enzyme Dph2 [Candidatus Diapherotrites archaeon]